MRIIRPGNHHPPIPRIRPMKTLVSSLASLAVLAGSTSATVLLSDDFSYADGSLTSNAAWNNHSGTPGDLLVSSGQAVVQHGIPSEDANTVFADQAAGTVYFGIDFRLDDLGTPIVGTDGEYFAHFNSGSFVSRLSIEQAQGSGDFAVGIATGSSSPDAQWATDLSFGTTYRATVAYDIDNDQAELWIDAASESDTSILGAVVPSSTTVSAFSLRQSDSSANETIRVDNLIVATTFAETIPETTSALLGALGLLTLLRRRRS